MISQSRAVSQVCHHHGESIMHCMRFAISIPQFYADGDFDPNAFRAYLTRAEQLGFDSA
jgi:hypothetical protein